MNILYCSQFSDNSGYASAARGYLKSLDFLNIKNLKILDVSVESISKISNLEKEMIKKYSFSDEKEYIEFLKNDFLLLWHYPTPFIELTEKYKDINQTWNQFYRAVKNCKKNINYVTWEADKIPESWLATYKKFNVSGLITSSTWNKKIFENQINIPCDYLPHVIQDKNDEKILEINGLTNMLKNKFVIFSMSQWQKRKGFDKLIQSYCMEFKNQQDVVLVIKTYGTLMGNYSLSKEQQNKNIFNEVSNLKNNIFLDDGTNPKANIIILSDVYPYENINWIYKNSNIFALLTRGEGFGLTLAEACINKLPIITINKTGHMDFIREENNFLVDAYKHPYIEKPEYSCDMNWYEPDILSARTQLRKAYDIWKKEPLFLVESGNKNYKNINDLNYGYDNIGKKMMEILKKYD